MKVYVGKTGNMRRRQATHAAGASHLAPLMHFALQQGYTILTRFKYLASWRGGGRMPGGAALPICCGAVTA